MANFINFNILVVALVQPERMPRLHGKLDSCLSCCSEAGTDLLSAKRACNHRSFEVHTDDHRCGSDLSSGNGLHGVNFFNFTNLINNFWDIWALNTKKQARKMVNLNTSIPIVLSRTFLKFNLQPLYFSQF